MIATSTGMPSSEVIVVLFTELPRISKPTDSSLNAQDAADAHKINMVIKTMCFLNLSPPNYY